MSELIAKLEADLRSLLKGQYSSLLITFNDESAPNYMSVAQYDDEINDVDAAMVRRYARRFLLRERVVSPGSHRPRP